MSKRLFTRRDALKIGASGIAYAALARLMPSLALADNPAGRRPNILLILADDMGFSDLGCYGSEIHTPNLDRLASGGVRFTHCYNAARCCPTRASLLTGLYAHQAGIGHMTGPIDNGLPGYTAHLNDKCVTLAEVLKGGGYKTYMVGKWHVGGDRPQWPVDRGFDQYFGLIPGGSNYFKPSPNTIARNDKFITPQEDFYMTDAFSAEACAMIDAYAAERAKGDDNKLVQNRPFFMYLAYTAPHWPLQARKEDIAKYKDLYKQGWNKIRQARHKKQLEMGLVKESWPIAGDEPPDWDSLSQQEKDDKILRMAVYAAQIDRLDQGVGKVIERLKAAGELDNTLVLFMSDNGGCAEVIERAKKDAEIGTAESFSSYGVPWATVSNTPFRYWKHYVHEGGISSPLIAHWPAGIKKPGTMADDVVHVTDMMATFVDISGATYPKTRGKEEIPPMQGRSFAPALEGKPLPADREIGWEHEGNRAYRKGKWKIVAKNGDEWALYDMQADRTETKDLSKQEPAKLAELAGLYDAWAKRCMVEPWDAVKRANARANAATKAASKPD